MVYIAEVNRSLLDSMRTYRQLCSLAISSVFPSLGSRGNAAILRPTGVNCCKRVPFKDHQLRIHKFSTLKETQPCKVTEQFMFLISMH